MAVDRFFSTRIAVLGPRAVTPGVEDCHPERRGVAPNVEVSSRMSRCRLECRGVVSNVEGVIPNAVRNLSG